MNQFSHNLLGLDKEKVSNYGIEDGRTAGKMGMEFNLKSPNPWIPARGPE